MTAGEICCGGVHQPERIRRRRVSSREERRRKRRKGKPGVRRASWEGSRGGIKIKKNKRDEERDREKRREEK